MTSLERLAEYHTRSHDRTNHLHMVQDHLHRACSVHGLSVDELHELLNAIHTCVAPNQGIDRAMVDLLHVCLLLEAQCGSEG